MTSIAVIENKISFIQKQLKLLKAYRKYAQKVIENDPTLKGAVERYLYLSAQGTIDLAEGIISLKKLRKPTTYSECFDILCENKVITRQLAEKLIKMSGFRNTIAHAYENIDFNIVYDVLQNKLTDIENFLKRVIQKFRL